MTFSEQKRDRKNDDRVWIILHSPAAENLVLLGRRGEVCKNAGQYGFFGGHVDPGESSRDAARRELFEETGMQVDPSLFKLVLTTTRKGRVLHYFTLRVDFAPEPFVVNSPEVTAYAWMWLVEDTTPEYVETTPVGLVVPYPPYPLHYSVKLLLEHLQWPQSSSLKKKLELGVLLNTNSSSTIR